MSRTEIITAAIAICGLALSMFNTVKQYLSDRVKVKLTARKNMLLYDGPHYHGELATVLTVINTGRRPVTIRSCGCVGLFPHPSCVAGASKPELPCEITEGKFITWIFDPDELDLSTVDYWLASDSHEREYKLREASSLKHWKSRWHLMWARRRRKSRPLPPPPVPPAAPPPPS